jgi:hypothetical protein
LGKKTDWERENGNYDVLEGKFGHLGEYWKVVFRGGEHFGRNHRGRGETHGQEEYDGIKIGGLLDFPWFSGIYIRIPAPSPLFLWNNLTRDLLIRDHLAKGIPQELGAAFHRAINHLLRLRLV